MFGSVVWRREGGWVVGLAPCGMLPLSVLQTCHPELELHYYAYMFIFIQMSRKVTVRFTLGGPASP